MLAFLVIGNDQVDEGEVIWMDTLAYYGAYSEDDVLPALRDIAAGIVDTENNKYQAARKKRVHVKRMKISRRSCLPSQRKSMSDRKVVVEGYNL